MRREHEREEPEADQSHDRADFHPRREIARAGSGLHSYQAHVEAIETRSGNEGARADNPTAQYGHTLRPTSAPSVCSEGCSGSLFAASAAVGTATAPPAMPTVCKNCLLVRSFIDLPRTCPSPSTGYAGFRWLWRRVRFGISNAILDRLRGQAMLVRFFSEVRRRDSTAYLSIGVVVGYLNRTGRSVGESCSRKYLPACGDEPPDSCVNPSLRRNHYGKTAHGKVYPRRGRMSNPGKAGVHRRDTPFHDRAALPNNRVYAPCFAFSFSASST